jgi:hypothetical protein
MRDIQLRSADARADAAIMSDGALCLKYAGLPFVSKRPDVQASYIRMRINGESHTMAEMLALRKFPGVKGTDSQFMAGTHSQDSTIDQVRYQHAKLAGVDTNGKRYIAGLARFPNDPEAWVSGASDVLRICEERGWNCHGAVEYEAHECEPEPDLPIGQDILDFHVNSCLAAYDEGERTPQLIGDITERVTQELTGAIDLDPEPKVAAYDDPFARAEMSV